jgi:hypothetical protein
MSRHQPRRPPNYRTARGGGPSAPETSCASSPISIGSRSEPMLQTAVSALVPLRHEGLAPFCVEKAFTPQP